MKKNDKAKKEQKPQGRVPKQPKGVTPLTDHDLEQVQGSYSPQWGGFTTLPKVKQD